MLYGCSYHIIVILTHEEAFSTLSKPLKSVTFLLSTFLYLLVSLTSPNLKNAIASIKAYPPAIIYPRVVRLPATAKVSHSLNNGAERNKDR